MKIYNEDKTQILEEYDLSKGYSRDDTLTIELEAIEEVEEESHYKPIKELRESYRIKIRELED